MLMRCVAGGDVVKAWDCSLKLFVADEHGADDSGGALLCMCNIKWSPKQQNTAAQAATEKLPQRLVIWSNWLLPMEEKLPGPKDTPHSHTHSKNPIEILQPHHQLHQHHHYHLQPHITTISHIHALGAFWTDWTIDQFDPSLAVGFYETTMIN